MKRILVLISILITIVLSGCTQKIPAPTSASNGVLIIPTRIKNKTNYEFSYYYSHLYKPETKIKIELSPIAGRRFMIIDDFPPGEYQIHSVKVMSAPTFSTFAFTSLAVRELYYPINFEIKPNKITLLDSLFIVQKEYDDPIDTDRSIQWFKFESMSDAERDQTVKEAQELPGCDLWQFAERTEDQTVDTSIQTDLSPAQQKSFKKFSDPVLTPHFKAFAIEIDGEGVGWSLGYHKPEHAIETAMQWCNKRASNCRLFAVGERVVINYSNKELTNYLQEYYKEILPPGDLRKIRQQALSGEEIRSLFNGRVGEGVGARTGNKFIIEFFSSGRLVVELVETKSSTKPGKYEGHWWIEGDRWCRKIYKLFSGRSECQYIVGEGNGAKFYNEEGAFLNQIEFTHSE